jgi:superfamily I DNA and/or RNA helicase/very-short-patch-repair endonuclease
MIEHTSQIRFDKKFIEKLLEKLKVGNTRSIHLNAIPGRWVTRLDLYNLSKVNENLPSEFINTLLNNDSFSFCISYDGIDLGELTTDQQKDLSLLTKRLNSLVIENNDNYQEFGIKNFGLGYPILIKRDRADPSKIIKAPLFLWYLDVERSIQNKNTWHIKKEEDYPIKLNEILISHLSKDESIQLEQIPKEILEDGILDKDELLELCNSILSQLSVKTHDMNPRISKCPDSKTIDAIAKSSAWIQWSGVLGIYRSQKETIIHATEELLDKADDLNKDKLVLHKFQTSTVSSIETDPSKEEIINTLTKDEIKLIQGPPGTGKSQSITAIISNALANKVKCLLVCEKKTALDVIQSNLDKAGIGNFSIIIDDINKDRKKVIKKARQIKENDTYYNFSEGEFNNNYKKFCRLKNELNSKYAELLKSVFGNFSCKRLLGLYLRFSRLDNFQYITERLDNDFLNYTHDEYTQYLNIIEEAGYLYKELEKNVENIFDRLNENLFSDDYKWSTYENVRRNTDDFLNVLTITNSYISKITENHCSVKGVSLFKLDVLENCEQYIAEAIPIFEDLKKSFCEFHVLDSKARVKRGFGQTSFLLCAAIFSTKYKKMYLHRKNISRLYPEAHKFLSLLTKFGFTDFVSKNDFNSYEELYLNLEAIMSQLYKLRSRLKIIRNTEIQLKKVERKLSTLKSKQIYNSNILSYSSLENYQRLFAYYRNFAEEISAVHNHLDAYESYHNWKYFLSKCNADEVRILNILKDISPDEWVDVFRAWYYRGALMNFGNKSNVGFNKSDAKLIHLSELHATLKKQQVERIGYIWNKKQNTKLSNFKYNFNILYNLRKNKTFARRNSLRKIIETDLDLFTTLFPVVLTNPNVVNAIFPLKPGLFDIVIFDEASQLRICDTFTSMIRGQYKIIAGDKHQMPPSNYFQSRTELIDIENDDDDSVFTHEDEQALLAEAESLLAYAEDLKHVSKSYLDFHYRSEHPALIDFSNCAFYGGNLIPFPEQHVYKPIEFREVNGRYESRTNIREVEEVLKIISDEIHPDNNGIYPSVGVATFNINQRNLLIECLNKGAEENQLFAQKMQKLNEKNLFVKNLENIQGDERDIIIISTTYGIKPDGSFSQNFARLNRIEGYKLLNVLVTRAKKKLYVCTSIPREKYLAYSDMIYREGNNRKAIFYAYLAYAEAISNHNNEAAENIMKQLKKQSYEAPRVLAGDGGLSESPFEEEVYVELLEHIPEGKIIQQHKIGGFRLDFLIKTDSKDIVLECDGKTYHQSDEAYAYDTYRKKELEKMGFLVYNIWSSNWFQDKEQEIKKLLQYIKNVQ